MTDHLSDNTSTFRELVQAISARVRPVCPLMPEEEFRTLVEQMARIEQKYIHYRNRCRRSCSRRTRTGRFPRKPPMTADRATHVPSPRLCEYRRSDGLGAK